MRCIPLRAAAPASPDHRATCTPDGSHPLARIDPSWHGRHFSRPIVGAWESRCCGLLRDAGRGSGVADSCTGGWRARSGTRTRWARGRWKRYPVDPGGERIDQASGYVGTVQLFEAHRFRRVCQTVGRRGGKAPLARPSRASLSSPAPCSSTSLRCSRLARYPRAEDLPGCKPAAYRGMLAAFFELTGAGRHRYGLSPKSADYDLPSPGSARDGAVAMAPSATGMNGLRWQHRSCRRAEQLPGRWGLTVRSWSRPWLTAAQIADQDRCGWSAESAIILPVAASHW